MPANDSPIVTGATACLERIPEHSISLMEAFSGGQCLDMDAYRFFYASDWLMAIGYPLAGPFNADRFTKALDQAREKTGARFFYAVAPEMPPHLARHIIEKDRFYVLGANAPIPPRLRNPVKRARTRLAVRQSHEFTPAHRRLWGEFMADNQSGMASRVAALYANTPKAMGSGKLRLLDAVDEGGNIAACMLLDHAPANFFSYILGAHSRRFPAPHAADLLFASMIELAQAEGKRFIHLGLGVNDGILRFKLKWGAKPALPFVMAQWQEEKPEKNERVSVALARAILNAPQMTKAQILASEPEERPFAMLWRLEKAGRVSWIGGTAHFFCHSFAGSFRSLFRKVDNVIFEGPLDPEFMANVDAAGKKLPAGHKSMLDMLEETEIRRLEQVVGGPKGRTARLMGLEKPSRADVRWLLANSLPWYAFFTLWTSFLERMGWSQSVDMEAWNMARDMNKNVIGMETLEEQLESLGSLPVERAINFFRACRSWKRRARQNMSAYLAGDLEKMMGSSAEFPTRTEHIVGRRDHRFLERMRPYLLEGNTAVFVGCAHMVNLRHMLANDGFSVRQTPFGIWPRVHRAWRQMRRPDKDVTW